MSDTLLGDASEAADAAVAPEVQQQQKETDGQDVLSMVEPEVPEQATPAAEPKGDVTDTEGQPDGGEQSQTDDDAKDDPYADVTLPEGAVLPAEALEGLKAFGKEHGLSKDAVAALMGAEEDRIHRIEEARLEQVKSWKAELVADPELGGENLKRTSLRVQMVLKDFPEVRQLLKDTGAEWNRHIVAFVDAVAASSAEPRQSVHAGVPAKSGGLTPRDIWPDDPSMWGEGG